MVMRLYQGYAASSNQQDELAKLCGPSDPYYPMAMDNMRYYLACAAALERGETHLNLKHKDRFK